MNVCVACHETSIDRCPCAADDGTCPHPIYHADFARQSFRQGRVTSMALQAIEAEYRRLKRAGDGNEP